MTRRIHGFSLLEAIVGVAIATAFLGAIAMFTTNLGDARTRLGRISREIECAEEVFTAIERACATAVVDAASQGAGIQGNESSMRIVRSAVGLGNDGQPMFSEMAATTIAFDSSTGKISVARGIRQDALAAPVRAMRIRYLAEDGWQDAFDSRESQMFPVGIEVSIWFDRTNATRTADASTRSSNADDSRDSTPRAAAEVAADRVRFFRIMGAPRVDPLAIRSLDKESSKKAAPR